jgi:WD40 repeat protein
MESEEHVNVLQPSGTNRKVTWRSTLGDKSTEIFCVQFDPEDRYIATGCGDGSIRVYNLLTGKLAYLMNEQKVSRPEEAKKMPTTAVRWRPTAGTMRTKNMLISVQADGSVAHWHTTSGKCLHRLHDEFNELKCIDFRLDGMHFATAGKDLIIRIYDETTKQLVHEMPDNGGPGHSNRIFAVKYDTDDPNILISGGWDNTVQIWDTRAASSIRNIFGPYLCGDALDIKSGMILTGSWRPQEQVQIYTMSTGQIHHNISWDGGVGLRQSSQPCLVYGAQYSKHDQGEVILAGGSRSNEARLFDTLNYDKPFAAIMDLPGPVYSVDFSHNGQLLALGCGDGTVRIFNINKWA